VRRLERTMHVKQCNHLHYTIYLTQNIQRSHGLDVSGIEPLLARDFPHPSRPALGPIQPPIQWALGHFRGQSGREVALTTHPCSASRLKI
jgi:hypothetical protein